MAITGIEIIQDNLEDDANLLAVHSPLAFIARATYSGGTPPDSLKATIAESTPDTALNFLADTAQTPITGTALGAVWSVLFKAKFNGDTLSTGLDQEMVGWWQTGTGGAVIYWLVSTGAIRVGMSNGGTTYGLSSVTIPTIGQWYYIGVTFDGSTIRIYIDGVLDASGAATYATSTYYVTMGARTAASVYKPFNGALDDVCIYNTALSAANVLAYETVDLSAASLLAAYNFNQGVPGKTNTQTKLWDASDNYNHATLTNVRTWTAGYAAPAPTVLSSYYCIPYEDETSTTRTFVFSADKLIKAEMDKFDDVYVSDVDVLEPVTRMTKDLTIYFHDPAETYDTGEAVTIVAAHASRQFGESPNMTDIYNNTGLDQRNVYGPVGSWIYIHMFNPNSASSLSVRRLSIPPSDISRIEEAAAGYYRVKVLVTSTVQTYRFYKGNESYATVYVNPQASACENSRVIRFLNRDGKYVTYGFSAYYQENAAPTQIGSVNKFVTSLLSDLSDTSNVGYRGNRELILRQNVDYEELERLDGLFESPRIYLYIGDGTTDAASDWIEVQLSKASGPVHRAKNLTGVVEISIKLPAHYSQTMY